MSIVTKKLGEIGTYINGCAFKPEDWKTSGVPIIRIENLNSPKAAYNYYQGEFEEKYRVVNGDILVSWSASLDAYVWNRGEAVLNQHIFKVIPNEDLVDKDFLFFLLKKAIKGLTELVHGATMKHVNKPVFENFEVAFPEDKETQRKWAKNLESTLTEIDKAREATVKTKQDLQAISNKQQQRALEILDELPRVPLSDYLVNIEAGKSIKTTELLAKKDELGVLKVSAVSWDRFQPDEAKSVIEGYIPPEAHKVKKGDLIISRANTLELVGAVVLVEDNYPNRLLSDKTLRLITNNEIIPEYLLYILKLPEARKYIEENATGTSNSMRNISQKTICTIPIPQANEEQQMEIIELMQLTRTELKKGEAALKLLLADLDLLPNKLLQEAFNEIENG